jgi:predicted nicotinamide N-methyase
VHKDITAFTLLRVLDFGSASDVTSIAELHIPAVFLLANVKFTIEQATKAQSMSRCVALPFL